MKKIRCLALLMLPVLLLSAQTDFYRNYRFTEADTLRGSLRPERTCYDVTFYDLNIRVDPGRQEVRGFVDIHYTALAAFTTLQIDLYRNMAIDRIIFEGQELPFRRRHDAVFVDFPPQAPGSRAVFRVFYGGRPTVAEDPPWDGGFVWSSDADGHPWVGVACEGAGASLWWPNKDHLSDEPDSIAINVEVPGDLVCVANGNLRSQERAGEYTRYHWFVSYPINNYNVTVNIARYQHFSDTYIAADGDTLPLDYYVLPEHLEKARKHFRQTRQVLACFEHYLGKYPFWDDGFAMVETPYLGMEHQGAIAYGNGYRRGYMGGMIPRDMDWDYIIVHESGHEYFGNSISCGDLSEMWIHESFTTYLESLFVEYTMSYADAVRYLASQRPYIYNREPVLGPPGVNWEDWEGSDHYFKGAWILHTLRHAIHDDDKWFAILKGFYEKYAISIVTTADVVRYVNAATGRDFGAFFRQYLEFPGLPVFEYDTEDVKGKLQLRYRWKADLPGFDMPLLVGKEGAYQLIFPTTEWQELLIDGLSSKNFSIATDLFLIRTRKKRGR